jgi:Na+-translocating ferredoxin:NAD+ oxidoreductase RnfG subunit
MDWTPILTVFAIVATNLVTVIMLFIHSDNKAEASKLITNSLIAEIQKEMKDFHARMEVLGERSKHVK